MKSVLSVFLLCSAVVLMTGCATNKVDWSSRIGTYTYDQAVLEMGPPDKIATLTDGTQVAEWLTTKGRHFSGTTYFSRGRFIHSTPDWHSPDYYVRLTFDPEGRLTGHRQVVK